MNKIPIDCSFDELTTRERTALLAKYNLESERGKDGRWRNFLVPRSASATRGPASRAAKTASRKDIEPGGDGHDLSPEEVLALVHGIVDEFFGCPSTDGMGRKEALHERTLWRLFGRGGR